MENTVSILPEEVLVDRKNMYKIYIAQDKLKNKKICVTSIMLYNEKQLINNLNIVTINQYLEHPNIAKCFYFSLIPSKNQSCKVLEIHQEYFPRGNLQFLIERNAVNKKYFEEYIVINYATQLLSAFGYMQKLGYCHRNIKAENIYVSEDGENVFIGDFKMCIKTSDTKQGLSICGSELYLSPEVRKAYKEFQKNCKNSMVYHNPYISDVYSLGLVFYELCNLKKLSESDIENLEKNNFNDFSSFTLGHYNMKKLLKIMLARNEEERKTFTDLINIFEDIKQNSICMQCLKFYNLNQLIKVNDGDYLCTICDSNFVYYNYEQKIFCRKCKSSLDIDECSCLNEKTHCVICKDTHSKNSCRLRIQENYKNEEFPLVMECKSCDIIDSKFDKNKFAFKCNKCKQEYCLVCIKSLHEANHKVCHYKLDSFYKTN
ncbi:hypothetical protein SteCoe_34742 [Stentor coeruleus]|uniref:Protein kinase domain-containing protein n=1 Tax=Stentor coeruleus TaxID=5963 RepID=A0A1R2ATZ7_9CILI|nr:hypothetical protein SteCoe_34742 [Stentor coeruleus]